MIMILTSIALAASVSVATPSTCNWDPSTQAAYSGNIAQVVDRFQDIPVETRKSLKLRIDSHRFDDVVLIKRDSVEGKGNYSRHVFGLQAGQNSVCSEPNREHWSAARKEPALAFCEGSQCLLVSVNGHHVSRVARFEAIEGVDPQSFVNQYPTAAAPAPVHYAPGRLLVGARAGLSDLEMGKLLKAHGGKSRRIGRSDLHIIDLPAGSEKAAAALLAKHPHLKFAELDRRMEPSFAPNDPYLGSQWHINKINANLAWDTAQGSGITIAILDSGVDGTHPDLAARMVAGWNVLDNNADASDVNGHGTAVAGAAAATLNNGAGVAAVAGQAKIMPVRISDANAYAYWSTVAQGLNWAADHGARVANISYAAGGSSAVQSAAQYMKSKGGLVIVAAGNNGIDELIAPTTSMIIVSATASNDVKTSWSSFGNAVSVAAPGQDIWTTVKGGGYQAWWGTSLASPVVAGVVGLMMSAKPSLSSTQVESLLFSSAVDLGSAGRDNYYGYGRVNAHAGVLASLAAVPADTQTPAASIAAPLPNSTVSGVVAVDVAATDNVGISKVELRVNGSTVATDTVAPFGFSWDSVAVANGMHNLVAYAFDAAGNSAASTAIAVNVSNAGKELPADTSAPVLAITNPVAGKKVSGTVAITLNASDNSGSAGIKTTLSIDGAQVAAGSGATLSYSWNTRKATVGGHTIQAVAQDAAGNKTSTSVTVSK